MSQFGTPRFLSKRTLLGLVLAVFLMAAGFQVALAGSQAAQPAPPISVRLPRLILRLNDSGTVQDLGVMISEETELTFAEPQVDFLSSVLGLNLRIQMFDAATMDALTDAQIQHVEIQTGSDGVALYGNAQFLMGVEWGDQEVLSNVAGLAEAANVPFARPIARIVPAIGANVLVELPTPSGAERTPPRAIGSGLEFPQRAPAAGEAAIVLHATGQYTDEGIPMVLGTPLADWGQLLGLNLGTLQLDPRALQAVEQAGIGNIGVSVDSMGTALLVDGEPVATVILGDTESLELTRRLAEQFQVPFAGFIPLASKTQELDIQVTVDLPTGQ